MFPDQFVPLKENKLAYGIIYNPSENLCLNTGAADIDDMTQLRELHPLLVAKET